MPSATPPPWREIRRMRTTGWLTPFRNAKCAKPIEMWGEGREAVDSFRRNPGQGGPSVRLEEKEGARALKMYLART